MLSECQISRTSPGSLTKSLPHPSQYLFGKFPSTENRRIYLNNYNSQLPPRKTCNHTHLPRMFERFQQPQKGHKSNLPLPPRLSFKTRGHISTRDSREKEQCLLTQSSLVTQLLSDSVLENFSAHPHTHNDTSATPTCERIFAVWIVSRLSSHFVGVRCFETWLGRLKHAVGGHVALNRIVPKIFMKY